MPAPVERHRIERAARARDCPPTAAAIGGPQGLERLTSMTWSAGLPVDALNRLIASRAHRLLPSADSGSHTDTPAAEDLQLFGEAVVALLPCADRRCLEVDADSLVTAARTAHDFLDDAWASCKGLPRRWISWTSTWRSTRNAGSCSPASSGVRGRAKQSLRGHARRGDEQDRAKTPAWHRSRPAEAWYGGGVQDRKQTPDGRSLPPLLGF